MRKPKGLKMTASNEKKNKIAFLGLGVMGFPMATHLKQAGYEVKVYNRTISKSKLGSNNLAVQWAKRQLRPLKKQTL